MDPFPEDEGELELVAFKMPSKLRDRLDARAKKVGRNRTKTIIAFIRWGLDELDEKEKREATEKKGKK
ncbi:MAG: hypothetical protein Q8L48_16610 [Archangium sp.]|nr:hypothetical protein [Archangium sp.]